MISSSIPGAAVIGLIVALFLCCGPVACSVRASAPGEGGLAALDWPVIALAVVAAASVVALWWADAIRPSSFARRARRDTSLLPWWGWLAGAAGMFVGQQLGVAIGLGIVQATGIGGDLTPPLPLKVQAILATGAYTISILMGAALLWVLRARAERGRATASGLAVRITDPFIGLGWFILILPVAMIVMQVSAQVATWTSGRPPDQIAHDTLREIVEGRADPWAWVTVAHAVVGAPITEELTYRIFLQTGLLALLGRTWPAIVLTSALFALMHSGVTPAHALPSLFVLGAAMGIAYERSRSPLVPILIHALFNGAMVAFALQS
jgi:membrane protease YdiL (CAAX protease family)